MKTQVKHYGSARVTLSDLRRLGRQGGAILYLEDGRQAVVKATFAVEAVRQLVNGRVEEVKKIHAFYELLPKTIAIRRDHTLIAERIHYQGQPLLRLTGRGYRRPRRKGKET